MGGHEMDLLGQVTDTVRMAMNLPNTQNTGSS